MRTWRTVRGPVEHNGLFHENASLIAMIMTTAGALVKRHDSYGVTPHRGCGARVGSGARSMSGWTATEPVDP